VGDKNVRPSLRLWEGTVQFSNMCMYIYASTMYLYEVIGRLSLTHTQFNMPWSSRGEVAGCWIWLMNLRDHGGRRHEATK
jgi:hypothetical protein